jgi:hypothetical protein
MKYKKLELFAVCVFSLASIVLAAGCNKSASSSSDNGNFSATVGGSSWASNYLFLATYDTGIGSGDFDLVGIQLRNGDTTAVTVQFMSPVVLNKAFSSDSSYVQVTYEDNQKTEYDGGIGIGGHSVIMVTSYDSVGHRIAGTFSGVLYDYNGDSLVMTNGAFKTNFSIP